LGIKTRNSGKLELRGIYVLQRQRKKKGVGGPDKPGYESIKIAAAGIESWPPSSSNLHFSHQPFAAAANFRAVEGHSRSIFG